jgi:hypothetical protein
MDIKTVQSSTHRMLLHALEIPYVRTHDTDSCAPHMLPPSPQTLEHVTQTQQVSHSFLHLKQVSPWSSDVPTSRMPSSTTGSSCTAQHSRSQLTTARHGAASQFPYAASASDEGQVPELVSDWSTGSNSHTNSVSTCCNGCKWLSEFVCGLLTATDPPHFPSYPTPPVQAPKGGTPARQAGQDRHILPLRACTRTCRGRPCKSC